MLIQNMFISDVNSMLVMQSGIFNEKLTNDHLPKVVFNSGQPQT